MFLITHSLQIEQGYYNSSADGQHYTPATQDDLQQRYNSAGKVPATTGSSQASNLSTGLSNSASLLYQNGTNGSGEHLPGHQLGVGGMVQQANAGSASWSSLVNCGGNLNGEQHCMNNIPGSYEPSSSVNNSINALHLVSFNLKSCC